MLTWGTPDPVSGPLMGGSSVVCDAGTRPSFGVDDQAQL